jgi:hypothetical protein
MEHIPVMELFAFRNSGSYKAATRKRVGIGRQQRPSLSAKLRVLLEERKQFKVIRDVFRVAHHDYTTERLGGSNALVINREGIERPIWNVPIERDDAELDIGQLG